MIDNNLEVGTRVRSIRSGKIGLLEEYSLDKRVAFVWYENANGMGGHKLEDLELVK